jgi:hypothetical protein
MPRKSEHYETVTCQNCGKSFTALKDKGRKYCSKECGYAGRGPNSFVIKGREEYEVNYRQALGVFTLMVDDAKDEMVRIRDKGRTAENAELLLFDSCQRWLMNQNGGLENLLQGVPGVHVKAALFELYRFATVGWKTAQRTAYTKKAAA